MGRATAGHVICVLLIPLLCQGESTVSVMDPRTEMAPGKAMSHARSLAHLDSLHGNKQQGHGQVHPLPPICGGQRCYQHYAEAFRCCPGYRCSFRVPFLGGMCIRDFVGINHDQAHLTPAPPGVEHTHSSLQL